MNKTKGYIPRGQFNSDFMMELPNYLDIIAYAKDPNHELDIQYRGNGVNIYYLGGSLLKLTDKGRVEFDENYFYRPSKSSLRMTDIERLINVKVDDDKLSQISKFFKGKSSEFIRPYKAKAHAIKADLTEQRDTMIERLKNAKGERVGQVLEEMKKVMYDWKKALKDAKIKTSVIDERGVQHYISLFNKEKEPGSEFVVLDLEYELSEKSLYRIPEDKKTQSGKRQPKIDIVAIEKASGQLYVMELKYGLKSAGGDAGVDVHYQDYLNSVGDDSKWRHFLEDINILYQREKQDGVLSEVCLKQEKPVFVFVLKPTKASDIKEFAKRVADKCNADIPIINLPIEKDYKNPTRESHHLILER